MPLVIVEDSEPAGRRGRTADDMDYDVDAAEALAHGVCHCRAAFGGGDIRRYEQIRIGETARPTARS